MIDDTNVVNTTPNEYPTCEDCSKGCLIKNKAYLAYAFSQDPELSKQAFTSSNVTELCPTPSVIRKLVGLKLSCKKKVVKDEIFNFKIVVANEGNVGLKDINVLDNLNPTYFNYADSPTVEVFDQNGTPVPPTVLNPYTVKDTSTLTSVNLTLIASPAGTPPPPAEKPYTLAAGWFAVFTFKVKALTTDTNIKNSATVSGKDVKTTDTATDTTNEIVLEIHHLSLTIDKSSDPSSGSNIACGTSVTYSFKVKNEAISTLTATDFTITDMFEDEFNYSSIKIFNDAAPAIEISSFFTITPPSASNHNTLTISPKNTYTGISPNHFITVQVLGTIVCCQQPC